MTRLSNLLNLKTRIAAAVLALLVAGIWLMTLLVERRLERDMIALLEAQQFSAVSYIATDIEDKLRQRIALLEANARLLGPDLLADSDKLRGFLKGRIGLQALFHGGLVVISRTGTGIADYPPLPQRAGGSFAGLEHFEAALATGRTAIGKPRIGVYTKKPGVAIATPVRDAAGQVVAVLAGFATLSDATLFGPVERAQVGASGWVVVNDPRYRIVVSSSQKERSLEALPPPGKNPMLDRFLAGHDGSGITVSIHGVEALVSGKQVPSAGWVVQMALPTAEAFAPIRAMKTQAYASAGLLTLLATLLLWVLIWYLLRPLDRATAVIGEMAAGRQELHGLPVNGRDEIGELLESFNTLVAQRRAAEVARGDSEARLKEAQRIAQVGSWEIIHGGGGDTGVQAMTWSDETYAILGLRRAEAAPSQAAFLAAIHPEDRSRAEQAWSQHLALGLSCEMDFRLLLADGTIKYAALRGETTRDGDGRPLRSQGTLQDTTDQALQAASLRESEERFRTIADYTYDWEYWLGPHNEMLYITPACERISGYSQAEFISDPRLINRIIHPDDREIFKEHQREVDAEHEGRVDFRILTKSGEVRWIAHGCRTVSARDGKPLGRRASNRDITALKVAEQRAHQLAFFDSLTGLANRRMLQDRLAHALSQARRFHRSLAVMFLDLDRFKQINDTLGHDVGDQLLIEVGKRLGACVRAGDTVSRSGGDEFVIVLPEISRPADATLVAEKILAELRRPVNVAGQVLDVTTSIGISIYPVDGTDDAQELMKKADIAMYAAKQAGRDGYRLIEDVAGDGEAG